MSVAYCLHKPSGCFWYRTRHPMDVLKKNGIKTFPIAINEMADDDFRSLQFYGAYPFSVESILKWMKAEGRKIVYDSDDALKLVDVTNPFYYAVKKDLGSTREILAYADEVTVSTPQMAEYLKGETKAPITVIPNCFDPEEWLFPRPKREGIRIGFAGASAHVSDLIQVLPTIQRLQEKHDVRFLLFGFGPQETYEEWFKHHRYISSEEATKDLLEFDAALSRIRFEWIPFVDFKDYPSTLINMSLDIGICPLKDTPFNRCRSACKAMEYTLSGALALASDIEPYREDKSSTLVIDWDKALTHFIENPQEIEIERLKNFKWLEENRDIKDQLPTLKRIYGVI